MLMHTIVPKEDKINANKPIELTTNLPFKTPNEAISE